MHTLAPPPPLMLYSPKHSFKHESKLESNVVLPAASSRSTQKYIISSREILFRVLTILRSLLLAAPHQISDIYIHKRAMCRATGKFDSINVTMSTSRTASTHDDDITLLGGRYRRIRQPAEKLTDKKSSLQGKLL